MAESGNCQICNTSKSKYSCPQCHLNYCSVSCYQSENHLECSENFYKQWVHNELKNSHTDSDSRKKMLEILKKNQEINSDENLDSDDDETVLDLADRINNVDLDDENAIWEKLTPDEKREFKYLLSTGNIIKILPEWEPWWKTKKRKSLIQDCSKPFDCRSICPNIPNDIPILATLTKTKPSPNIAYMLVNVLISYVFTVRWFKGGYKYMPVEAISTCIALSSTLRNNYVFNNAIEAFAAFDNDFTKCKWLVNEKYDKFIIQDDLIDIIKGSNENDLFYCVKAAICDLNSMCLEALDVLKQNNTNHLKRFSGPLPGLKLLRQISKKMNYYLSWTVEYGSLLSNIF